MRELSSRPGSSTDRLSGCGCTVTTPTCGGGIWCPPPPPPLGAALPPLQPAMASPATTTAAPASARCHDTGKRRSDREDVIDRPGPESPGVTTPGAPLRGERVTADMFVLY